MIPWETDPNLLHLFPMEQSQFKCDTKPADFDLSIILIPIIVTDPLSLNHLFLIPVVTITDKQSKHLMSSACLSDPFVGVCRTLRNSVFANTVIP